MIVKGKNFSTSLNIFDLVYDIFFIEVVLKRSDDRNGLERNILFDGLLGVDGCVRYRKNREVRWFVLPSYVPKVEYFILDQILAELL